MFDAIVFLGEQSGNGCSLRLGRNFIGGFEGSGHYQGVSVHRPSSVRGSGALALPRWKKLSSH